MKRLYRIQQNDLPIDSLTFISEATDGLVVLDGSWRYIYVNEPAAQLSGHVASELLDRSAIEVHPDFENTIFFQHYAAARAENRVQRFEFYYPHLERWYTITVYPSPDQRLFIYFSDITPWKRKEEQLRLLVDNIEAHAICMLSPEGTIIRWNPGAQQLFGYTSEEAEGKHLSMLYLPEHRREGQPLLALADAAENGRHVAQGWQSRRRGRFWSHYSLSAIRDSDGVLVGFTLVAQDRTVPYTTRLALEERTAQLEREKAKADALLSSIGEGVIATDGEGKIVLFNPQAERMTHVSEKEALGRHYGRVMKIEAEDGTRIPEEETALGKTLATGKKHESPPGRYFVPRYGNRFPVVVSANPLVLDGELTGVIAVLRNVTKEHDADRAKSEFVSLVSHQLRTPLTAMKLLGDLLAKETVGSLSEQQLQIVGRMNESTEKMIALVNALLNVSRIENSTLTANLVTADFSDVVDEVISELRPLIRMRQLVLRYTPLKGEAPVTTDPGLLRQVVANVVSNAIQYSPRRKHLEIEVRKKGSSYVLSVRDWGIGIPEDMRDRVFARFFRSPGAVKHKPDGTGLGLYLSHKIMELLGGRIWFKPGEGGGTVFNVSLPAQ